MDGVRASWIQAIAKKWNFSRRNCCRTEHIHLVERRRELPRDGCPIAELSVEKRLTFDATWKRRACDGDERAVRELVDASLEPLYRFSFYRVGRNRHLCEEVVQETVLRAIAELPNYAPERSANDVFPWLSGFGAE